MKNSQLFTTPEEIDKAIADFKNLQTHAGWLTLVRILNANIEEATDKILHKEPGVTEADLDRLRGNLAIMEEIRDTPEKMIKVLATSEDVATEPVDVDNIYDTVTDKPASSN